MTAWPSERAAIENMIAHFGSGLFACVMDSYDYAKVPLHCCPLSSQPAPLSQTKERPMCAVNGILGCWTAVIMCRFCMSAWHRVHLTNVPLFAQQRFPSPCCPLTHAEHIDARCVHMAA
jgi:hypothetical protein